MPKTTSDVFADFPTLSRTADEVFNLDDLRTRLRSGKKLRIKYGVDVTAPFLHIGHAVNLWAMREMQEAGHKVVFLVGDFTTRIGDPTGKSATRPIIPLEQIERDAEAFIQQVGRVLLTDPEVFEVRRNSEWWDKIPLSEFLGLLAQVTHARLIQRDMFQQRIERGSEIYMHEMLYPLLQGYDSEALDSDITIVGSDQLFNELMGRFYQERFGHAPQVVITTKITPGIDGREKQSKSLGNYIALDDTPRDKYGKAMSMPDNLVRQFLEVYTLVDMVEIAELDKAVTAGELNPMVAKKVLAQALVQRYHGPEVAAEEQAWFEEVFSNRSMPEDIPVVYVPVEKPTVLDILRTCLPGESLSELRRLIDNGAVKFDGKAKITEATAQDAIAEGAVLRIGKRRWFRISFKAEE